MTTVILPWIVDVFVPLLGSSIEQVAVRTKALGSGLFGNVLRQSCGPNRGKTPEGHARR